MAFSLYNELVKIEREVPPRFGCGDIVLGSPALEHLKWNFQAGACGIPIYGVGTRKRVKSGIRQAQNNPGHLSTWLYQKKAKNAGLGREKPVFQDESGQEPRIRRVRSFQEQQEDPKTASGLGAIGGGWSGRHGQLIQPNFCLDAYLPG